MSNNFPTISVIVPVYNVIDFIDRCYESIIKQTFSDFELLLIDDGSTDGSGVRCDNLANRDSRVKVVHKNNGGLSDARNVGIETARGKYLFFIDSDDYIDISTLEDLYHLSQKEHADIVECQYTRINEDAIGEEIPEGNHSNPHIDVYDHDEAIAKLLDYQFEIVAWNKLYLAKLFAGIRFPVGKLHEDEYTTPLVVDECKTYVTTDQSYYMYVQRSGSIMNSTFTEKNLDLIEANLQRIAHFNSVYGNTFDSVMKYHYYVSCSNVLLKRGYSEKRYNLRHIRNKLFSELIVSQELNNFEKIKLLLYRFTPKKLLVKIKGGHIS